MEKENLVKENGKFAYNLIKEVVDATGPRLPGSEEEKKGAEIIAKQFERELGVSTITEKFTMAPIASIGAIPILGFVGLACVFLFYLSPIASLILSALAFIIACFQIFAYSGVFDFLFPKKPSQNVYAVLEPKNKTDMITIILSGHMDSSWCWNHSKSNPKTMILKTGIGVLSFVAMIIISLVAVVNGAHSFKFIQQLATFPKDNMLMIMLYCLPIVCIIGLYWLSTYLSYDKKIASPGAMDNMSGVALSIATAKYFQKNPSLLGDNVRIITIGLGSEEAGLKGALAFCDAHKQDKSIFNDNTYCINLDSFRDDDYFNVVKGDIWLMSHFDQKLIGLSLEAMRECGLKPSVISNPVGGCDSTPFYRAGIKTITLNAQNPTATSYYHTTNDTVEGLSMYSLEKGFETVIKLLPKIVANHNKNIV